MDLFTEYRLVFLGALVVIGLLFLLKLLRYGLVLRAVYFTPFVLDRSALITQEQIPQEQRALLQAEADSLLQSGFTFLCAIRSESDTGSGSVENFSEVYVHPDTLTYASLRINQVAWIKLACVCDFANYLRNGQHIVTSAHAMYIAPTLPPRMLFEAPMFADVAERWQYHRARIESLIADSVRISPAAGLVLQRTFFKELAHHLLREQRLRRTNARGVLRYTLRGAHAVAIAVFAEMLRWQKFKPGAPSAMLPAQEAMAFAHARSYTRKTSRWGKLLLLLVTAGLFSVAFGAVFSWELVLILLGVLFFHELGHFAAMKLFGYRDLSIFFIPLLGAATTGTKEHATPMQKVLVYLAGPVPGLVLGVVAWYGATMLQSPTLMTLSIVALVINLLNLLPFSPLDGGRIVEVLWFSRFPRVRVGFALMSALGLGALALYFGDFVLGGLALLLLTIVPGEWRIARLIKRVREDGVAPEPELLRRIFTRMNEIYAAKTDPLMRHDVAKRVLESSQEIHPRLLTSLFGSAVYLGSFFAPIAVAVMIFGFNSYAALPWLSTLQTPVVQDIAAPDWEAQLRAAQSPEEQWNILIAAGTEQLDSEDMEDAWVYFARAADLADTLPERDLKRAKALLGRAEATQQPEEALADYREVDQLLVNPVGAQAKLKAEALERIADYDPALSSMEKTQLFRQSIWLYEASGTNPEPLPYLRLKLARVLDEDQNAVDAEAMLRAGIASKANPADHGTRMLVTQLGWFLIAHHRAEEAIELLTPHLPRDTPDPQFDTELLTALAWAQNAAGQHSAALTTLARIQPFPNAMPFSKPQLPILTQIDVAACMKASHNAELNTTLQALAKRFTTTEQRQRYAQQMEQRMQFDPWQASRWKAHRELLLQMAAS